MDMHVSAPLHPEGRYTTYTLLDRNCESPSLHFNPRNHICPPPLMGIRRFQSPHCDRLKLLQAKTRRIRTRPQDPLGRVGGMGHTRSRHVRLVQALDGG